MKYLGQGDVAAMYEFDFVVYRADSRDATLIGLVIRDSEGAILYFDLLGRAVVVPQGSQYVHRLRRTVKTDLDYSIEWVEP